MVHQHFSLIPALTVAENLALAAEGGPAFFRRSADLAGEALELAGRLGWQFDPRTPVSKLPVGRQQRLEILKILQRDARWLLFDEPTAVLSPPEAEELFAALERLRGEGRGIVFISHKLPEVLRLCDRVTVLRQGRSVGERRRGVTAAELARLMVGESGAGGMVSGRSVLGIRCSDRADRAELRTPNSEHRIPTPHEPALVVRDLRVLDARGLEAVRGVSFEVRRGEVFGIAGVDGNGQTELAEAVVGLRPRLAGTLQADDGAHRPTGPARRPGYIPEDRQHSGLVLPLSVRDNLALEIYRLARFRWGPVLRLPRLWAATRAMAQRFDIRNTSERQPVATLSGGNQQKIVVARALDGERTLLVAVNPTRGLDLGATEYVHGQLRAARDSGVGVLLMSTDLDEVLALSDRVGVLFEGRLQGIVSPRAPREEIGQMMGGKREGLG